VRANEEEERDDYGIDFVNEIQRPIAIYRGEIYRLSESINDALREW
jgi:hypothetical protein